MPETKRRIYQTFACSKCNQITEIPNGIECLQCEKWFCDNCFDCEVGDGCSCHKIKHDVLDIPSTLDTSTDLRFCSHELEHAIVEHSLTADELQALTEILIRMNNLKSRINLRNLRR